MDDHQRLKERHKTTKKVTLVGAFTNLILSALQIVFGWLTHSQALVADGLHTLSDLISDFIVLFASSKASEKADEHHPYGHARIETLASVILGLFLIAVGIAIGVKGIYAILGDTAKTPDALALVFAAIAIISKEVLFRYTLHYSKKIHSLLLESNAHHHRSDVFSSLVVFIGIGGELLGIPYFDIAAAFVVALMIMKMGAKLSVKALKELIDTALDDDLIKKMADFISAIDGVCGVHSLRTRSMGGLGYIDVDIEVNPKISVSEGHFIASQVEQAIKAEFKQIQDVKIHIDPYGEDDIHQAMQQLPSRSELLLELYNVWSNINNSDEIKNVNIHYLSDAIEIDLILPISLAQKNQQQSIETLKEAALAIPVVTKLHIYYK